MLVTSWLLAKSMGYLDRGVQVVADLRNIGDGLPAGSDVKYRGSRLAPSRASIRRSATNRTRCGFASNRSTRRRYR
ncbi:MCE-family Mce6A domain protein [Mycobacterium ulcerans str. Harvey]|uniref:MCE-family Mce6A domain protein n=1 Tax=Mycobacterium ulcerans str. Harvey TaxID=1299332 RepID=A0ABP3A469_MYCUL|nr:MCE-family Mce6A domain protein [Mycobacterium ulcerans str. Harvey]